MLWSNYIQTPDYLDATRQILLNNDLRKPIIQHCGIVDSSRVLEIGCGTGCFMKYISVATNNVSFIGVDQDVKFIENGKRMHNDNQVQYVRGSAYDIPFEDNFFDVVCSHTFFNCVEDPCIAMKEIKRVANQGAIISSITAMSLDSTILYDGKYPTVCKWNMQLKQLKREFTMALESIKLGPNSVSKGISTAKMPHFFHKSGLEKISIFPIGYSFSLSDSSLEIAAKQNFVEKMYLGEISRLDMLCNCQKFLKIFSSDKVQVLKELLFEKKQFWLNNLEDESIWEWVGGSMLLVSGINPKSN